MSTLATRLTDLSTRIATEIKANKTLLNGNAADLSGLNTTTKANIVAALNEVLSIANDAVAASGATIDDDATSSTTKTYSVTKIRDLVSTSISALTDGAPEALDTLTELSAALGNDADFGATVTTALGNRVRVDADQGLNSTQKTQARANIGVDITTAEIGDPDTNFVTVFNAGLV